MGMHSLQDLGKLGPRINLLNQNLEAHDWQVQVKQCWMYGGHRNLLTERARLRQSNVMIARNCSSPEIAVRSLLEDVESGDPELNACHRI